MRSVESKGWEVGVGQTIEKREREREREREKEKAWVRGPWSRASVSTGLTGKRCYPALEAQGVPQGHESGSFCRRPFYRSGLPHELKASFEFSGGPELACFRTYVYIYIYIYYCIDKHAHVFVSIAGDRERSRRFAAFVVVRSKLRKANEEAFPLVASTFHERRRGMSFSGRMFFFSFLHGLFFSFSFLTSFSTHVENCFVPKLQYFHSFNARTTDDYDIKMISQEIKVRGTERNL